MAQASTVFPNTTLIAPEKGLTYALHGAHAEEFEGRWEVFGHLEDNTSVALSYFFARNEGDQWGQENAEADAAQLNFQGSLAYAMGQDVTAKFADDGVVHIYVGNGDPEDIEESDEQAD